MRAAHAAASERHGKRHERLKELMMKKIHSLNQKAGCNSMGCEMKAFAEKQIELLMKSGKMSEGDLHKISVQIRSMHDSSQKSSAGKRAQASSTISTKVSRAASVVTAATNDIAETDSDLWAKLCHQDVDEWIAESNKARQKKRVRMDEQRAALDLQVKALKELKIRQVEQEKLYAKREEEEREAWKIEKSKIEEKKKEACMEEKRTRDEQLQLMKVRKAAEEKNRKTEDERIIAKLREDIKQEQQEKQKVKAAAREEIKRYIEINKAQNAAKEKTLREEAEMDRIHQRDHLAKLERQEREREEALKRLADRQTNQIKIAQQMAASINEKAAEDEKRAVAEMQRKWERLQKEEKEREDKAAAEKEEMRRYLVLQISDKEKMRAIEHKRCAEEREQLKRDLVYAENMEAERKRQRKMKDMTHKKDIERQIEERRNRKTVVMSSVEKLLNSRKLHTLPHVKSPKVEQVC
eukprot:TRINITY_DN25713_c0_g1_i1.p1 TRINITY_DN25713_c0_g1~~TRINITY_DN25713_c0_g1_i1.p1  ORF type:complete len:476 (+),score=115.13 TRINITY_DN25713_c0_g1_i1:28-1428(+)